MKEIELEHLRSKRIDDLRLKLCSQVEEIRGFINELDSESCLLWEEEEREDLEPSEYHVEVIEVSKLMHMTLMSIKSAEQLMLDAIRRSEGIQFEISI